MMTAAAKERSARKNESGSSTLSKTKHRDMNKMVSGSKDLVISSTGKRDDDTKKQRSYIHHTAEKFEVNALK